MRQSGVRHRVDPCVARLAQCEYNEQITAMPAMWVMRLKSDLILTTTLTLLLD